MKADCAVKRMCKEEKQHERVGQKIHREVRAEALGTRKISPLFLDSCTCYLFTFRQRNDAIILTSKKQVLKIRASKSLISSLHRGEGRWRKEAACAGSK